MIYLTTIIIGKLVQKVSCWTGLGAGGTWPGEIALKLSPRILQQFIPQLKKGVIVISGTNGKTTTALMIQKILEKSGHQVIHNASGANLLNGVVSVFIHKSNFSVKMNADWGGIEVDENVLLPIIHQINHHVIARNPDVIGMTKQSNKDKIATRIASARNDKSEKKLIIGLLNLFRDQLDRYGEIDVIAEKWSQSLAALSAKTTVILNADDPQVAYLGKNLKLPVRYFGLDNPKYFLTTQEHATDSVFCVNCGKRLKYQGVYYSHIGIWRCASCGLTRPTPQIQKAISNLAGLYNQYNALAAATVAQELNVDQSTIDQVLNSFHPAFGRQEEFVINNRTIKIFLAKNPTGFNVALRTVIEFIKKDSRFGSTNAQSSTEAHSKSHPEDIRLSSSTVLSRFDKLTVLSLSKDSLSKDSVEARKSRARGNDGVVILLVLNDRIPDGRDVSWIWDVDFETIPDSVKIVVSGDRVYDLALRIKYSKFKILNSNLIIQPNLKEAFNQSLKLIDPKETLFILPTYSAMLEVRKILTGKKIL